MPIDRNYQANHPFSEVEEGLKVWGSVEKPLKLGIHGSIVAVDLDLCFGCMKCIEVCTVDVFEAVKTPKHPISSLKVKPIREAACFMCFVCEIVCPVDAILVDRGSSQGDTLQALLDS